MLLGNIDAHFPHFHLEDKVNLFGAGIVTNQNLANGVARKRPEFVLTYSRRRK